MDWAGVSVMVLDLTDTYRTGLSPRVSHSKHVADPFHVARAVNTVRRRIQNE